MVFLFGWSWCFCCFGFLIRIFWAIRPCSFLRGLYLYFVFNICLRLYSREEDRLKYVVLIYHVYLVSLSFFAESVGV